MFTIEEQLKDLLELANYLNSCPASCYQAVLHDEINRRQVNALTSNTLSKELMQWRCQTLHQYSNSSKMEGEQLRYLTAISKVPYHLDSVSTTNTSSESITTTSLLSKHLAVDIINALTNRIDKDISLICINDLLTETFLNYKRMVYKEALVQFELITLIIRRTHLDEIKSACEKSHRSKEIKDTILPEMHFIDGLLSRHSYEPQLQETKSLIATLEDSIDFSLENLNRFVQANSNEPIANATNPMASIKTYFNNDVQRYVQVQSYLTKIMQEAEGCIAKTSTLSVYKENQQQSTNNTQLIELRTKIAAYRDNLGQIENDEKNAYKNRNDASLMARRKALTCLERCVNRANTVTPELKAAVGNLIFEIKSHQPKWKELRLLDAILAVIGYLSRGLVRFNNFQEHLASSTLEQQTTRFQNDNESNSPLSETRL